MASKIVEKVAKAKSGCEVKGSCKECPEWWDDPSIHPNADWHLCKNTTEAAIAAHLAALKDAGYVVVPVEKLIGIKENGYLGTHRYCKLCGGYIKKGPGRLCNCEAMVAAAQEET